MPEIAQGRVRGPRYGVDDDQEAADQMQPSFVAMMLPKRAAMREKMVDPHQKSWCFCGAALDFYDAYICASRSWIYLMMALVPDKAEMAPILKPPCSLCPT